MPQLDPVALTQELIRRPSVTPADEGAMDIVQRTLEGLGFSCRRMKFGEIENLYARYGTARPNLCFAGHTDVVPVGDAAAWSRQAFAAEIVEGMLIGRGAVDMKSAVAAFAAAAAKAIAAGQVSGSLSFLITGDEEGVATHGTKMVVEALAAEGEVIDHCVVGEPSSAETFGDTHFDDSAGAVTRDGKTVVLTAKEYALAQLLFRNLHRALSRTYILETVWGNEPNLNSRSLDMHISRIRSKLELRPQNGYRLAPVYSYGYRLERLTEDAPEEAEE